MRGRSTLNVGWSTLDAGWEHARPRSEYSGRCVGVLWTSGLNTADAGSEYYVRRFRSSFRHLFPGSISKPRGWICEASVSSGPGSGGQGMASILGPDFAPGSVGSGRNLDFCGFEEVTYDDGQIGSSKHRDS